MKKSILIFSAAFSAIGLMAFGCIHLDDPVIDEGATVHRKTTYVNTNLLNFIKNKGETEIFYDVGPRFMMTMTKDELNKVRSFTDFNSCENPESIVSFYNVSVIVLDHNYNFVEKINGKSAELNAAQLRLLRSVPYSTDLLIRADFLQRRCRNGFLEDNYTTPHITVIPEKQAVYSRGKYALVDYVKKETKKYSKRIGKDDLRPGKVRFTVTTEGTVRDVFLESTSGNLSFDADVIELISKMPGTWTPAENGSGEKVAQQLVFTFGIVGC